MNYVADNHPSVEAWRAGAHGIQPVSPLAVEQGPWKEALKQCRPGRSSLFQAGETRDIVKRTLPLVQRPRLQLCFCP